MRKEIQVLKKKRKELDNIIRNIKEDMMVEHLIEFIRIGNTLK